MNNTFESGMSEQYYPNNHASFIYREEGQHLAEDDDEMNQHIYQPPDELPRHYQVEDEGYGGEGIRSNQEYIDDDDEGDEDDQLGYDAYEAMRL